jgi:hypothetical protein
VRKFKNIKHPDSLYILSYLLEPILKIWWVEKFRLKYGKFGPFFNEKSFVEVEK